VIEGTLWLLGCGNMGGAMLARWIATGIDPAKITVIDPNGPTVPDGVRLVPSRPAGDAPDIIVLAVKPQQLGEVGAALGTWHPEPPLVLSILAGVETGTLANALRSRRIVRAMPNLPVSIGKGVVALCAPAAGDADRAAAEALAGPLGHVEWIDDEAKLDAVTALAGSGPGFLFRFVDALARGGEAIGLGADQAMRLAVATAEGSAMLAAAADVSPAALADRVASKGGSTREGLNVLDRDEALVRLLTETLAAARRRNAELAAAAR